MKAANEHILEITFWYIHLDWCLDFLVNYGQICNEGPNSYHITRIFSTLRCVGQAADDTPCLG